MDNLNDGIGELAVSVIEHGRLHNVELFTNYKLNKEMVVDFVDNKKLYKNTFVKTDVEPVVPPAGDDTPKTFTIKATPAKIKVGEVATLTTTPAVAGVTYTAGNANATVSGNKVTGAKVGSVVITGKATGYTNATVSITVEAAASNPPTGDGIVVYSGFIPSDESSVVSNMTADNVLAYSTGTSEVSNISKEITFSADWSASAYDDEDFSGYAFYAVPKGKTLVKIENQGNDVTSTWSSKEVTIDGKAYVIHYNRTGLFESNLKCIFTFN